MYGLNKIQFKTKEDVESLLLKVPGVKLPKKKVPAQSRLNPKRIDAGSFDSFMAEQHKRVETAKVYQRKL